MGGTVILLVFHGLGWGLARLRVGWSFMNEDDKTTDATDVHQGSMQGAKMSILNVMLTVTCSLLRTPSLSFTPFLLLLPIPLPPFIPSLLRHQPPQTQIIHHVLDIFDSILDPIAAFAQGVVLEVEDLEAGVHVFDESCDAWGEEVVAEGYGVAGEAGLWWRQMGTGLGRGRGGKEEDRLGDSGRGDEGEGMYQFVDQRDEREEVLFDGEVEGVVVFEVDGDCDPLTVSTFLAFNKHSMGSVKGREGGRHRS